MSFKGRKGAKTWAGRLPGFAMAGLALLFAWPMLKGWAYGVFPPEPASAEDLPQWRSDFDAAALDAKASGNPILIDFMAPWCPPCRVMEADVWPDPEVREAVEAHVVPLQVDLGDPASAQLSRKYGVRAIPTILLVNSQGEEIARNGYMGSRSMIDFIERFSGSDAGGDSGTSSD